MPAAGSEEQKANMAHVSYNFVSHAIAFEGVLSPGLWEVILSKTPAASRSKDKKQAAIGCSDRAVSSQQPQPVTLQQLLPAP